MKTIRLENRSGNHFKFYELWAGAYVDQETGAVNSAFVGIRYGRIGTEGQTNLIEFEGDDCKTKAYACVQKKIREKQSHGYEITAETESKDLPGVKGIDKEPAENSQQMSLGKRRGV